MLWRDLNLIFDLVIVTLNFLKSCLGFILDTIMCKKVYLGRYISLEV